MSEKLMSDLTEEEPEPYEGKMKPGHFQVLVHPGTGSSQPLVLEFVDMHPDVAMWLEDDFSNVEPFMEDTGWRGPEVTGLCLVTMRYTVNRSFGLDGPDDDVEWVEVERTPVLWDADRIAELEYDAETARLIEEHDCDVVITPPSGEADCVARLIGVRPETARAFRDTEGVPLGEAVRAAVKAGGGK